MPICIISLKQEDQLQQSTQLGREGLKILLRGLDIPEFDQELRIVKGIEDKITFAFTVGGEEYPEHHPGVIFGPDENKIREVGSEIKELIGGQSLKIETYRDSAFMMIDPKLLSGKDSTKPPSIVETDGLLPGINAEVKLTVNPKQYSELQLGFKPGKELSPPGEDEIFTQIIKDLARITESNIGQENKVKSGYEIALQANAPAAVEIKIKNDTLFSKEGLFGLALELNGEMVKRNLTGEGSSIWVTQEAGKAVYLI